MTNPEALDTTQPKSFDHWATLSFDVSHGAVNVDFVPPITDELSLQALARGERFVESDTPPRAVFSHKAGPRDPESTRATWNAAQFGYEATELKTESEESENEARQHIAKTITEIIAINTPALLVKLVDFEK